MTNIPPSELCFLSGLPAKNAGDKVRFLGCVKSYNTTTGVLTLQHQHPPASRVHALVNVDLVLERLTHEQVLVGEWVNVMGYVAAGAATGGDADGSNSVNGDADSVAHVQALLLWSAGPLDLQNYEKRLAEMLSIGQQNVSGG